MGKVLLKFQSCPIVRGYCRDAIYDLDRNTFEFIPKSLTSFIEKFEGKAIASIKSFIKNSKNIHTYEEYLNFLIGNEFVFFCNEKDFKQFIKPSRQKFDIPYLLKTVIIQYNSTLNYHSLIKEADSFHIPSLSFDLCFSDSEEIDLGKTIELIKVSAFYTINFKLSESEMGLVQYIHSELQSTNKHIFIYFPYTIDIKIFLEKYPLINFRQYSSNGIKASIDFIVNYDFYYESLTANPFYNKKLFVNKNGMISAISYLDSSLGSIYDPCLDYSKIFHANYEIWNIPKTIIKNCKVCEFRFMCCTSNIPVKEDHTWVLSTPCNYNPLTAEWIN